MWAKVWRLRLPALPYSCESKSLTALGEGGRISARDLKGQMTSCSCLTLILACIIYWQAKEIERVVTECNPEECGIDLPMLEHIIPSSGKMCLLYGEYVINSRLIRAA